MLPLRVTSRVLCCTLTTRLFLSAMQHEQSGLNSSLLSWPWVLPDPSLSSYTKFFYVTILNGISESVEKEPTPLVSSDTPRRAQWLEHKNPSLKRGRNIFILLGRSPSTQRLAKSLILMPFNGIYGLLVLYNTLIFNDKVAQHSGTTQGHYPGWPVSATRLCAQGGQGWCIQLCVYPTRSFIHGSYSESPALD